MDLVIVDSDPDFEQEVTLALKGSAAKIVAATQDLSEVSALALKHKLASIILGPNLDLSAFCKMLKDDAFSYENKGLIFCLPPSCVPVLENNYIYEVLTIPFLPQELISAVERVNLSLLKKEKVEIPTSSLGKILTVFSTKGGVGKTVIATNLAVILAQSKENKVVLLDLDLQFGDVGVMLKLRPEHTIYDCLSLANEMDGQLVEKFLTIHSSGVRALLAPLQPELADLISSDSLEKILYALRQYADFIIVDTPASFNDHVLSLLDQTDLTLLVATMDIPSVKNIKLCLQTLESLQYPEEKTVFILNRADDNLGLRQPEIEKVLHKKVAATIPTDKKVPLSINRGVPVVIDSPKSAAARSLNELASLIRKVMGAAFKLAASA